MARMAGKSVSTREMESMVLQIRNDAAEASLAPSPVETEESRKRVSFGGSGLPHAAVQTVPGNSTGGPGGAVGEKAHEMSVPIGSRGPPATSFGQFSGVAAGELSAAPRAAGFGGSDALSNAGSDVGAAGTVLHSADAVSFGQFGVRAAAAGTTAVQQGIGSHRLGAADNLDVATGHDTVFRTRHCFQEDRCHTQLSTMRRCS